MQGRIRLLIGALLLAAALLGGCANDDQPEEPAVLTPPPAAATTAPAPGGEPSTYELGEVQEVPEQGFSFQSIEGFSLVNEDQAISMQAPDAGENTGPGFFLTGGTPESFGASGEDVPAQLLRTYLGALVPEDDSVVEEPRRVALNQAPGMEVDFTVFGDEARRGRITVVQKSPDYVFVTVGLSPADRWDTEFKKLYRDLLQSVEFIGGE